MGNGTSDAVRPALSSEVRPAGLWRHCPASEVWRSVHIAATRRPS